MYDRTELIRKALYLVGGLLCFAMAFVIIQSFKGEFAPGFTDVPEPSASVRAGGESGNGGEPAVTGEWVVYVTGAVKNPGVYRVPAGARVYQALDAAGGFSAQADKEAVNLAAKLEDGDHIRFPTREETQSATHTYSTSGVSPLSGLSAAVKNGVIDINRATAADLQSLPGIGPKMAETIIAYRDSNGGFKRVEDIMLVRCIGPKRFDAMKERLSVGRH